MSERMHPHVVVAVATVLAKFPGAAPAGDSLDEAMGDAAAYVSEGICPCDEQALGVVTEEAAALMEMAPTWSGGGPALVPPRGLCPACGCVWGVTGDPAAPTLSVSLPASDFREGA